LGQAGSSTTAYFRRLCPLKLRGGYVSAIAYTLTRLLVVPILFARNRTNVRFFDYRSTNGGIVW
jgi:hypothetical protein